MSWKGSFTAHSETARRSKGDPLEKVTASAEWSIFRPLLNEAYVKEDRKSPAGRPPWGYLMLFKVLLLQEWYEIADDNTESQVFR